MTTRPVSKPPEMLRVMPCVLALMSEAGAVETTSTRKAAALQRSSSASQQRTISGGGKKPREKHPTRPTRCQIQVQMPCAALLPRRVLDSTKAPTQNKTVTVTPAAALQTHWQCDGQQPGQLRDTA